MPHLLHQWFPLLSGTAYAITSPVDEGYNCIAWAAGDTTQWWWPDPDGYWPRSAPFEESVPAFVEAYRTIGYLPCATESLEAGYEKVALFACRRGIPTHAALQLPSGEWTSKVGSYVDITHELRALEGEKPAYGYVVRFLKRPRT